MVDRKMDDKKNLSLLSYLHFIIAPCELARGSASFGTKLLFNRSFSNSDR